MVHPALRLVGESAIEHRLPGKRYRIPPLRRGLPAVSQPHIARNAGNIDHDGSSLATARATTRRRAIEEFKITNVQMRQRLVAKRIKGSTQKG
jgi:hypothetical protein